MFALGSAFGVSLILARSLGAANYGVYVYATAWASLLAVPSLFGLDTLSVRNLAADVATTVGNWPMGSSGLVSAPSLVRPWRLPWRPAWQSWFWRPGNAPGSVTAGNAGSAVDGAHEAR